MCTSRCHADDACLDPAKALDNVLRFRPAMFPRLHHGYVSMIQPWSLRSRRPVVTAFIIERMAGLYKLLPLMIAGLGSRQSGWGLDF